MSTTDMKCYRQVYSLCEILCLFISTTSIWLRFCMLLMPFLHFFLHIRLISQDWFVSQCFSFRGPDSSLLRSACINIVIQNIGICVALSNCADWCPVSSYQVSAQSDKNCERMRKITDVRTDVRTDGRTYGRTYRRTRGSIYMVMWRWPERC